MYIETRPAVIGKLQTEAQQSFSRLFRNDWVTVRASNRLVGPENIRLESWLDDETFGLSDAYAQFLPAIHMVVQHERSVRKSLVLSATLLTIRQRMVDKGKSQQSYRVRYAHQDSDGSRPERFYTVSDNMSTQYYPDLTVPSGHSAFGREVCVDTVPWTSFDNYDIVHASALTFHRSPPMLEAGFRTFMRLTFRYEN